MEILTTCMDVTREWRDAALTMIHKFVPSTITNAIFLYYGQTISSVRAAVVVALGHLWAFRHYCEHQMGWLFAREDVQHIRQWLVASDVLSYLSSICVILAMIYLFLALRKSDDGVAGGKDDSDMTARTTTVGHDETSNSGQQSSRGGTLVNSFKNLAKTKTNNGSSTGHSTASVSKSPFVQLPPLELTNQTGATIGGGAGGGSTTNKMGTKTDTKSAEKNKLPAAASSFAGGGRGGGSTPMMSPEGAVSIYADSRYSDNDSQGDSDVDASPAGNDSLILPTPMTTSSSLPPHYQPTNTSFAPTNLIHCLYFSLHPLPSITVMSSYRCVSHRWFCIPQPRSWQ